MDLGHINMKLMFIIIAQCVTCRLNQPTHEVLHIPIDSVI